MLPDKTCPKCGNMLVHDEVKHMWRCEKSFPTARQIEPECDYWEEDNGKIPNLHEAILRVKSRKDIVALKCYEKVCDLFS